MFRMWWPRIGIHYWERLIRLREFLDIGLTVQIFQRFSDNRNEIDRNKYENGILGDTYGAALVEIVNNQLVEISTQT